MPVLPGSFYQTEDVLHIARTLIGKTLCTSFDDQNTTGRIVETEAYRAPEDKASHAYGNKRTKRTETMFGPAGHAYIYLCYGIHHLFNVVTGPVNTAHAVLIRAVEPLTGLDVMAERRNIKATSIRLTAGPGILTKALGLTTKHNGYDLTTCRKVWIEDSGFNVHDKDIIKSPRVGVDYAEECAAWNWRFRLRNNPWTSKPH